MSAAKSRATTGPKPKADVVDLEPLVGKPMPAAIEAEQAILGSILRDATAMERIDDLLDPVDFFATAHQIIYKEMREIIAFGNVPNMIQLGQNLRDKNQLDAIGGAEYLFRLPESAPDVASVRQYAKIVAEKATLRKVVIAASETLHAAYLPGAQTANEVVAAATDQLFDVADQYASSGDVPRPVRALLSEAVEFIEAMYNRPDPNAPLGVTTGYTDLDTATLGLTPRNGQDRVWSRVGGQFDGFANR